MRVPVTSAIYQLFTGETGGDGAVREDLSWWESQGKKLDEQAITVEGRKVADRVIAIVQPMEVKRRRKVDHKGSSLLKND
jgi:hypothetical protein